MKVFNQAKADAVKMLTVDSSILTFCSIGCRIDFVNSVYTVYAGGLYGCWQCGEDMLQGLLLNKPADDDNLYRQRRQER